MIRSARSTPFCFWRDSALNALRSRHTRHAAAHHAYAAGAAVTFCRYCMPVARRHAACSCALPRCCHTPTAPRHCQYAARQRVVVCCRHAITRRRRRYYARSVTAAMARAAQNAMPRAALCCAMRCAHAFLSPTSAMPPHMRLYALHATPRHAKRCVMPQKMKCQCKNAMLPLVMPALFAAAAFYPASVVIIIAKTITGHGFSSPAAAVIACCRLIEGSDRWDGL